MLTNFLHLKCLNKFCNYFDHYFITIFHVPIHRDKHIKIHLRENSLALTLICLLIDYTIVQRYRVNFLQFVVCSKAIDLGIIMDASSSVRRANYNKVKAFIKDLSDDFTIGSSETRFGIIHYSNSARLDFTPRDTK